MTHQCSVLKSFIVFLARICISLIFVVAGYDKIVDFNQYATMLAAKGVPYAEITLVLAIIFEFGGGLLILLGWYARFGALLIFLFIIPVTYFFHSFWEMMGTEMINNIHHFLKNLAIIGGLLYVMACGAGHISIDGFIRKKCCQQRKE